MIAAPLHRLLAAEYLFDASAQRFGPIDDEQIFAIRGQSVIAQMSQQSLDAGGVLRRSRLDSQNVLLAFDVHAHRAENVMRAETLAIDVDHQNLDVLPAPLLQLLELLGTRLDGFAADGAARNAHRLGHLRQDLLVFPRRNAAHQRTQHVLAEAAILAQHFVSRNLHFAFGLVAQPRPLHLHLAVRQLDAARLRSVVPDLAAGFAWRTRAGHLLGAQHQDLLQHLMSDFVDHVLDYLAGILDQVDDGKQDLAVGLAELLDDGGRLARSAGHDVVSFLHGGRLLSDSCLATGFYRIRRQPPPTNLQLSMGHPHVEFCTSIATDIRLLVVSKAGARGSAAALPVRLCSYGQKHESLQNPIRCGNAASISL